jgi:hypothetical protein
MFTASWIADLPLDRRTGGLLEQRNRELEHFLRLALVGVLRIHDPVQTAGRARHEQREGRGAGGGARGDGIEQRGRGGGPVRDDQDTRLRGGFHGDSFDSGTPGILSGWRVAAKRRRRRHAERRDRRRRDVSGGGRIRTCEGRAMRFTAAPV